jgi:hypothetical protein
MSAARFLQSFIAAISFCVSLGAQTPVVVYEDSTNYSGQFNQSANEYGDEVILFGNAHFVTQFQFEYFGNFTSQGDETARLRFYANTGPIWMGNKDYVTPAPTPLWETVLPISPGFNTATITVPYVDVPLRFTWTIQFFGMTMTSADNAGLLFYGKPSIGSSFNDYWELLTAGWTPRRIDGLTNNFAAKIMAVSAAPPPPELSLTKRGANLVLSWPPGLISLYLESKTNVTSAVWEPVMPLALRVGDVFQTTIPVGADNRIFRLNSQPRSPLAITAATAGSVRLRWSAAVGGQKIQVKSSLTETNWTDVLTPTRPIGDFYEATIPVGSGSAFFRLMRAQ